MSVLLPKRHKSKSIFFVRVISEVYRRKIDLILFQKVLQKMETILPNLPEVLMDEIQKIACIKKSNGKTGNNFIIICNYKGKDKKSTIKEIYEWLFSCLDNIKHPAIWDGYHYTWEIILDTHGTTDEDDDEDDPTNEENNIYFYIHTLNRQGCMDEEGLIYVDENPPFIEMSANYILEHIGNEPEYIVGIGISAVSNEYMAKQWWIEIEGHEGYMVRPMWNRCIGDQYGWSTVRETSYNFGWKNYPPAEINQLLTKNDFKEFIDDNFDSDCLSGQFEQLFENLKDHGDYYWGRHDEH